MTEHEAQASVFLWADLMRGRYPELGLLFAVPNGGKRHPRTAALLKAEGVRAGVPDMFLPVARNGLHGLFIELKVGKNRPTPEQREWITCLAREGYRAEVAVGAAAAIEVIQDYLGIGRD